MSADPIHERLMQLVGAPMPARTAPDPLSAAQVRRWVEAFGYENPAYADIAPPAMLGTLALPGLKETRATIQENAPLEATLRELGLVSPAAALAQTYDTDLRIGCQVTESTQIASISPRKQTALGAGYFINIQSEFHDQHNAKLGAQTLTVFAFDAKADRHVAPTTSEAPPEAGEPLRELRISLDRLGVIACISACNDFKAGHYDPDIARSLGFEDIFTDIHCSLAFAQRYATAAIPDTRIASIELKLGSPHYAGDTLTLQGYRRENAEIVVTGLCRTGLHMHGRVRFAART